MLSGAYKDLWEETRGSLRLIAGLPRGIEFQTALLVCGGISDVARRRGDWVSGRACVVGVV